MAQNSERIGRYIAATATELSSAGPLKRFAALVNQRVLFGHRGEAELLSDRLELRGWNGSDALVVRPSAITAMRRTFTSLYGRFVGGGSAEWGAPVIISRASGPDIYLLFDHRAVLEKSSNVDWHVKLVRWQEHHHAR